MTESEPIEEVVLEAEDDMRKVYDLAIILNDYMGGTHISRDIQEALCWLTSDLVIIGKRLNDRFDALHRALPRQKGA